MRDRQKVPDPSDVVTAKAGDLWSVALEPMALPEGKRPKADRKGYIREGDGIITAGITKMKSGGGSGSITSA